MARLIITLHVLLVSFTGTWCLQFECYPNGTIVVTNPNLFFRVVDVKSDNDECLHSFSEDFSLLRLDNCRKDAYVQVMFIKNGTLILKKSNFAGPFGIMCKEIPVEGVVMSVGPKLLVPFKADDEVRKVGRIISALMGSNSEQTEEVMTGDELDWTFKVPAGHVAIPENCKVSPGTESDVAEATDSYVIIQNGCSKDLQRVSDFSRATSHSHVKGTSKLYSVKIAGFQYNEHQFITLECSMRICEDETPGNCIVNCSDFQSQVRNVRSVPRDTFADVKLTIEVLPVTSSASFSSTIRRTLDAVFVCIMIFWSTR